MWQLEFTLPKSIEKTYLNVFSEIFEIVSIFETTDQQLWLVKVFFETEPSKEITEQIEYLCQLNASPKPVITVTKLPEKDWLAENRKDFPALTIAGFYIHGSHIPTPQDTNLISIQVDASLAFGTGEHATTQGCLEMIAGLPKPNKEQRILDLGCGTAILAIAMAKLWDQKVIAADIDEDSVTLALENCQINHVSELVNIRKSDGFSDLVVKENIPYDLIVANILAGPLCELAPEMKKYASKGAEIILSGLLIDQKDKVLQAYFSEGFKLISTKIIKEWATLHLKL